MNPAAVETLRTIGVLFEAGDIIEIRGLNVCRTAERAGRTQAGYFKFENQEAIATAIKQIDATAEGVYVVLNRLNPDLLARSNNRLKISPKQTTGDADIIEWRWLYIDIDSKRPSGISATDAEHDAALQKAKEIREFLAEHGWPEPVHGDSGNGAHLLYRLPLLELKQARDLVKNCLRALAQRFSDSETTVDEATANAARLCKLYGTMARKGDSTPERPHRRSALLETPERIVAVPFELLEALASEVITAATTHPEPSRNRSNGAFDVDNWLLNSGLDVTKGPEPYAGGRRWTIRTCWFNPEHVKPVIIQLASGALVYRCLHNSCSSNDWQALRRAFDPNYQKTLTERGAGNASAEPERDLEDELPLITDLSQLPSVYTLDSKLNWLVENMIADGSVTLICAESGTGKTWLGYHLAGCVAHGTPVLGMTVRACPVLYLDGENPLCVVKQRLADLSIAESPNLKAWGGWNLSPPVGPQHPLIMDFARDHRPLIIYDSLIEFHPGSEQSSTETRAFMRHFRALANLGASVVILHHTGKSETSKLYRGSSDIKGSVDTAYLLARKSPQDEELGQLTMNCFKSRLAPGRHFGMEFQKGRGLIACEPYKRVRTAPEAITEILAEHRNSTQTEILTLGTAEGFSKNQLLQCLKTGGWSIKRGPKNAILYNLPEEGLDNDETHS